MRKLIAVSIICLGAGFTTRAASEGVPDYEKEVKPLLTKYCYDCHGDGMDKGGLVLDSYANVEAMRKDLEKWQLVIRNVRTSEMPPPKKKQPTLDERETIIKWVEAEVFQTDCNNPDPGRVTIRRLNRAEYNNTIRDLVGVNFQPAEDFPVDDVGYGFDNIGDVLSMSPLLFEKYLTAAEKIMADAIVLDGPKLTGPKNRVEAEKMTLTAEGSGPYGGFAMSLMKEGEVFTEVEVKEAGEYYLRARAFGTQAGTELPKLEFRVDSKAVGVHEVSAYEKKPALLQTKVKLEPGKKKLAAAYINNFVDRSGDRNLYVDFVELEGPLAAQPYPETHQRIFFKEGKSKEVATEIIGRFAKRAFRRPVGDQELERLMRIFEMAQKEGDNFEQSVRVALEAVLVSPHFLFRGELQPEPNNPKSVHEVNEYALATRLSYFLWSTMPDEQLFALADKKELRKNLDEQVKRMLADPKAITLVKNFAAQWLQIRNLASVTVAEDVFPEYDNKLRVAMEKETELFFEAIMRENRSVLEFIDSDFTFVNERLAQHYGIPDVKGEEFRKVSLKGTQRGGVLTHASILTITSNPTRTSLVKRGKWILENILGSPPPPPPPDTPELEQDKEAVLSGSLRQRLEQHRAKPICASCHERMDPLGFGFENFDAIGLWREKDGQFPIDSTGQLVSGEKFNGPAELKQILLSTRKEEFLRTLTDRMLTYALGRGLEYYDKCAIDAVLAGLVRDDYKFHTLIAEIVKSVPFQKRRGEGERLAGN